ncbi:glycoside hydrolase family 32 protein, partial [Paenibacillus sp. Y412MC10]|uniref:glycoside hydrolase family 32 protein n=1 Tax=Geobacillus sp. (strain Y412MC10) TaxID=481743 RepID=UPI0011A4CA1E
YVWECGDVFEVGVEGWGEGKWVLMMSRGANANSQGSDGEYFIGDVMGDGKFMNDDTAGKVVRRDWGKEL